MLLANLQVTHFIVKIASPSYKLLLPPGRDPTNYMC